MLALPGETPSEQNNFGSGTFIAGDNYGRIETLDAKTKAALAKISQQAPALGRLLIKALRDGVISPDTALLLHNAARSINEDVASSLQMAAANINEDVANSLRTASENINPQVAHQISAAVGELNEIARRFEESSTALEATVSTVEQPHYGQHLITQLAKVLNTLVSQANRIERMVTPPPPKIVTDWKVTRWAFLWGAATGAIAATYLAAR
ncbi:hypothetical protein [Kitasatospora sp. NPDC059803]|uniref:hypothetical protein n=1 Tax=Kitasatospora sp. NPDC059803 TaxID=3346953 RepID=UPI003668C225